MLACTALHPDLKRSTMKIFFADDSEIIRKRLRGLVEELKDVDLVGEAGDVVDALEALRNTEVDVVILDIRMPGGNGMAVLKELMSRNNPPVVIIYTSFAFPQYQQAYLEAGADYFFDKARDGDRLIEAIVRNKHKN